MKTCVFEIYLEHVSIENYHHQLNVQNNDFRDIIKEAIGYIMACRDNWSLESRDNIESLLAVMSLSERSAENILAQASQVFV